MSKPEAKVESYLVTGVEARGGWCRKMIDKGRKGAPDRVCDFPQRVTIEVETKASDGHLDTWQERYHERLRSLGHIVLVLWTIAQVDKFFADYDRGVYG